MGSPALRAVMLVASMALVLGCRGAEEPKGRVAGGEEPAREASESEAEASPGPAAPVDERAEGAAASAPASAPCLDTMAAATPPHDTLTLTPVAFSDLPGWADDRVAEAVPAFLRSCDKLRELADDAPVGTDGHGGRAHQWRRACAAAARVKPGDDDGARRMFEAELVPHSAAGKAGQTGKMTGYYVAEVRASRTRKGKFQIPVLGRPDDLVMVDLSSFIADGHGRRIWGRMDQGKLVPYYTRRQIRDGALAGRGLELMYVDDPVDLLFAQIEGSARATLDDGTTVRLEFAGKNGRAYRGVGAVLRDAGLLQRGEGTMQGIRQWFRDNPARFHEIADQNASYVFFMESKHPGAVGSQRVTLTPRRSIAVDRAFIALSTPIWVDARAPVPGKKGATEPWRRLLIAQDTGGGILGAVRGDIFWGDGAEAADRAGRTGGPGRFWLLLPRGVAN